MVKLFLRAVAVLSILTTLMGCTATEHRKAVSDNSTDRVTVGKVQSEIRVGMSGGEVAQVLGSPNVVSTDEEHREVWIYDKIATDTAYSKSSGGVSALFLSWSKTFFGNGGPGYKAESGASSKSQRTLTIIIKFDEEKKVRDFAYHTSRF